MRALVAIWAACLVFTDIELAQADMLAARTDASIRQAATSSPIVAAAAPAFLGKIGVSANSYLEIYGDNLSQTTRSWSTRDFNGASGPTTLDGVSVTVNGRLAVICYVSPRQVNVVIPEDVAVGPVPLVLKNASGTSNSIVVYRASLSPTLETVPAFLVKGKQHIVAFTTDFKSYIGAVQMIAGIPFTPAKPGDTITFYALGCGPTSPITAAGSIASRAANLVSAYDVRIGGKSAPVKFAGLVSGGVGLYQFNVVIPDIPAGEQPIELIVGGVSNAQNLVVEIGGATPVVSPGSSKSFSSELISFDYPPGWTLQTPQTSLDKIDLASSTAALSVRVSSIKLSDACELVHDSRVSQLTTGTGWQIDTFRQWAPFSETGSKSRACGDTKTSVLYNKQELFVIAYTTLCSADKLFEFFWAFPQNGVAMDVHDKLLDTVRVASPLTGTWSNLSDAQWGSELSFSASGAATFSFNVISRSGTYVYKDGKLTIQWTKGGVGTDSCTADLRADRAEFHCPLTAQGTFLRRRY